MAVNVNIIADSVNPNGERITTFELEYPRMIHSEVLTHRDFSRNASSSRAIPIMKMLKQVWFNMAYPAHWGKKQRGMQADNEVNPLVKVLAKAIWWTAGMLVSGLVGILNLLGVHKQVANRMLEPWTHIKVVLTATKLDNWFNLRLHKDAQPEIYLLAYLMKEALAESTPTQLAWNEWHLPYVTLADKQRYTLEETKQISTSSCAQVSYRVLNTALKQATKIYSMLVQADVFHASPFEHPAQATPTGTGNFTGTGWTQYRSYIEQELYHKEP